MNAVDYDEFWGITTDSDDKNVSDKGKSDQKSKLTNFLSLEK